jgi:2-amino-4-hydroxy-6-hydroxymethyldihydropteridine diphosphokinase
MGPPQPHYANAVIRVRTSLTPKGLMALMGTVESASGRFRTVHWGPRTLDLDLLLYGPERVLNDVQLTLPHPGLASRRFVLAPLCELDPDLNHPCLDRTMQELLQALQ